MKNYIIYQAHTRPVLFYEVIYSIYSFGLHHNFKDYHFLIYTDSAEKFKPYLDHVPHTFHDLNQEKVMEWMGKHSFIHRVKIKMLQDILKNYSGSFLYVDSDTYFTGNLKEDFEKITSGRKMMHCMEGETGSLKMYRKLINYQASISSGEIFIDHKVPVWNAGALGFTNDAEKILGDVLEMTDLIQSWYPKHISEQFAFSYFFKPGKSIDSLDRNIFHYWILKEFQEYLNVIFNHPSSRKPEMLSKIVQQIDPRPDTMRKEKWRNHSGLYRAIQRWMGRDFKMERLVSDDLGVMNNK